MEHPLLLGMKRKITLFLGKTVAYSTQLSAISNQEINTSSHFYE
jgi:hypothetical protein